jgi:cytochrome c oxidase subunit I
LILTPPRAWTLVACLAFIFATLYAIAVVIFRLPFFSGEHGHLFRIALALHVELAVFFWLMATMAGQWAAARGAAASRWPAPLAAAGTILLALSPLAGGVPLMADYFPWLSDNLLFSGGFSLFCCAVLAAGVDVLRAPPVECWRGVELAAWPTFAAATIVIVELLNGAAHWAEIAWGAGHVLLFAHVVILCRDWSALSGLRQPRAVLVALAVIGASLVLIPLIFVPGTLGHRHVFTFAMTWLLWPLPIAVGAWTCFRLWSDGSRAGLARLGIGISFALLVLGCLLGAAIVGETTLVTAHYHAAVGAVAISRMSVAYLSAAETALAVPGWSAMRRQLVAYTVGLALLAGGLVIASIEGAPRKTSAGELTVKGPYFKAGMSISGFGGLAAMLGAGWLVLNLVRRPRA